LAEISDYNQLAREYKTSVEVRGYEIDGYGHVNHAEYIHYMEFARWKLLEEHGINLNSFSNWKAWPVISELKANYIKPCHIGDILEIRTSVEFGSIASISFFQKVYRENELTFDGYAKVVMINEKGHPTRLPKELSKL